ncbi:H-NS family nucleoid-associated regulatory protein [Paraburkholderia flagellata]|uniref:H-NS family nucleoid-associated regulatory protein n=1 Tax=Paraburkholderia flagellata TaxID=2883241 RepID=UPI001F413BD8|nr:H-NS family nucleoid-associated regulatory protein [Paraburkholderia flagellata]
MEEFGITPEALAESIQFDVDHPPLYRDAKGNEWNGIGKMPDWLHAAKHAGVHPDFFRVERNSTERSGDGFHQTTDRQFDLFR